MVVSTCPDSTVFRVQASFLKNVSATSCSFHSQFCGHATLLERLEIILLSCVALQELLGQYVLDLGIE